MKLKVLSLTDLERVRLWRNEQQSMLRTPFLLTKEQQEIFYRDVICNRQANARFWGIWIDEKVEYECPLGRKHVVVACHSEMSCYPVCPVGHEWGPQTIGTFIGMCGLENISWENRLAEISLLLNPEYPMDKCGEESLQLLLHEGFMNMNLENIYTEVYACNPNLKFWAYVADKYGCLMSYLPARKYLDGQYFSSSYINISKGAFVKNENLISESTQTLN